jgi:hypothetical protein
MTKATIWEVKGTTEVAGDIEHITNEKVHPTLNIKSTTMIQSEV